MPVAGKSGFEVPWKTRTKQSKHGSDRDSSYVATVRVPSSFRFHGCIYIQRDFRCSNYRTAKPVGKPTGGVRNKAIINYTPGYVRIWPAKTFRDGKQGAGQGLLAAVCFLLTFCHAKAGYMRKSNSCFIKSPQRTEQVGSNLFSL